MLLLDSRQRSTISSIRDHPVIRHLSQRRPRPALKIDEGWFIEYLKADWPHTDPPADQDFQPLPESQEPETPIRAVPIAGSKSTNTFLGAPRKPRVDVENPFLTLPATRSSRATFSGGEGVCGVTDDGGSTAAIPVSSGGTASRLPRWKVPDVKRTWKQGMTSKG